MRLPLRACSLVLPVALLCAGLWPASSGAYVGCSLSGGTLTAFMNEQSDSLRIVRHGDDVAVVTGGSPSILLPCAGGPATVNDTDRIVVDSAATAEDTAATIDLSRGPLSPGATPEPDGTSEIEIRLNLTGEFDIATVIGSDSAEALDLGRAASTAPALNLNPAAEAAPDPDLELAGAELLILEAGGGNDVVTARGAPGFAGPFPRQPALWAGGGPGRDAMTSPPSGALMVGEAGNDRLRGAGGLDVLAGGGGRDLIKGGKGGDQIEAARFGRDRVNCGGGEDSVLADRKDRLGGCEKVRHSHRRFDLSFIFGLIIEDGFKARGLDAGDPIATANFLRRK